MYEINIQMLQLLSQKKENKSLFHYNCYIFYMNLYGTAIIIFYPLTLRFRCCNSQSNFLLNDPKYFLCYLCDFMRNSQSNLSRPVLWMAVFLNDLPTFVIVYSLVGFWWTILNQWIGNFVQLNWKKISTGGALRRKKTKPYTQKLS